MKALLIVTLLSGLQAEPAVMSDMKTCLAQVPAITKQTAVQEVVCIPYMPKDHTAKFREMMAMFLDLIDTIKSQQNLVTLLEERNNGGEEDPNCFITSCREDRPFDYNPLTDDNSKSR